MSSILTPRELADTLRCSEATIRAMANRGDLPEAFRVGKLWRIHATALDRLAPIPATITASCPDDAPQSPSPNAPRDQDATASDGANTARNAKNAGATTRKARKTAQTRYGSAFARDFPEHASIVRSAS